jgi:hypothetical protein
MGDRLVIDRHKSIAAHELPGRRACGIHFANERNPVRTVLCPPAQVLARTAVTEENSQAQDENNEDETSEDDSEPEE